MNRACYLCGGKETRERPGKVRDIPNLKVLECISCGLVFLSSFSHIGQDFYESSQMHAAEISIEDWVRETRVDDDRRFLYLSQLIQNKSILDFGCGTGGFLKRAKTVASMAMGLEIEKRLKPYFRTNGLTVADNLEAITDDFDFITLFHVLEHMEDPIHVLKSLSSKLKKNGRIILEVPNADDVLLTLYKNKAFSEFTYWSCHLFLFNNSTISNLAKKAGFQIEYVKQVQRYSLANHIHWLSRGTPGGHQKWHFLDAPELHAAYEKQLASLGCCDTLMVSLSL